MAAFGCDTRSASGGQHLRGPHCLDSVYRGYFYWQLCSCLQGWRPHRARQVSGTNTPTRLVEEEDASQDLVAVDHSDLASRRSLDSGLWLLLHSRRLIAEGRRPSRHYTEQELSALFSISSDRVLFYQMLFYTAGRKGEVASLVWGDFTLNNLEAASVTFRANVTKTKRERVVPLILPLAQKLWILRGEQYRNDSVVFQCIPTRKQLLRDLFSAAIERKDALGCVVHFHAFRKTARTLAIAHGVSERVCDAILGHESEHRMGTRYTDMRGVPLSDWLKLPWLGRGGDNAQLHSLVSPEMPNIRQLVLQLVEAVKVHSSDGREWSGRQDSNLRPPGPKPGALPG
ncbi:Phage integrase family protein [Opitutus sp. GAS368]|nr:Phage integrase family protein [Opitutus sp. GAS368]